MARPGSQHVTTDPELLGLLRACKENVEDDAPRATSDAGSRSVEADRALRPHRKRSERKKPLHEHERRLFADLSA